jgi:hypothetical protein
MTAGPFGRLVTWLGCWMTTWPCAWLASRHVSGLSSRLGRRLTARSSRWLRRGLAGRPGKRLLGGLA